MKLLFRPLYFLGILFFLLLGSCHVGCTTPHFTYSENIRVAHAAVLDMRLVACNAALNKEAISDPDNLFIGYFRNYSAVLVALVSGQKQVFEKGLKLEQPYLNNLEHASALSNCTASPWLLYCQAETRLLWAFGKLKYGREVSAGWNIRAAFLLSDRNLKLFPGFVPSKATSGILNLMAGAVPSNYEWLLNTLGLHSNVALGRVWLQQAVSQQDNFGKEAEIFNLIAQQQLLANDDSTLVSVARLGIRLPHSPLGTYLSVQSLLASRDAKGALDKLAQAPRGPDYFPILLLSLKGGDAYLALGELDKAEQFYKYFLASYRGQAYVKAAYFGLAQIALLRNKPKQLKYFKMQIIEKGTADLDVDKKALVFGESEVNPKTALLKARLNFDGGHYDVGLKALRAADTSGFKPEDKVELAYRLGRYYQETAKYTDAVYCFNVAYIKGKGMPSYFAANAALQSGYIAVKLADTLAAVSDFNKVLACRGHSYKNALDTKARAALANLK